MPLFARLVAEETISSFTDANNGAGPLWCYGSRTIARVGDTVYAAVAETAGPEVKPLCNTRWVLYRRRDGGKWERVTANPIFDEREPCPLAALPDGRLALSVNPGQTITSTGTDGRAGYRCEPRILLFDTAKLEQPPQMKLPSWDKEYFFSEHSYRALAVDPVSGAMFITNQVPLENEPLHAYSYYDGDGRAVKQGLLRFPMRGCYQQIAVRGKAVYVLAISDEVEPNPEWRAYKKQVTGRDWDYDFRQLYYTWTPDITTTEFSPIATVFSRDDTAGHVTNCDMAVDAQGDAHLLFLDRNIWYRFMRDRFFPGVPTTVALKYARVHNGRVVNRLTLAESMEELPVTVPATTDDINQLKMQGSVPSYGTFHVTADGRLFVLWHQSGMAAGNFIRQLLPQLGAPQRLPLEKPLVRFNAASQRNGCPPSDTIDLIGLPSGENVLRYVQVKLSDK